MDAVDDCSGDVHGGMEAKRKVGAENIVVNGSKIFECTYGAIHMEKSELKFKNSTIESCIQLVDSLRKH